MYAHLSTIAWIIIIVDVSAFTTYTQSFTFLPNTHTITKVDSIRVHPLNRHLSAKNDKPSKDDENVEEGEDQREGMADAFKSLNSLSSLDLDDDGGDISFASVKSLSNLTGKSKLNLDNLDLGALFNDANDSNQSDTTDSSSGTTTEEAYLYTKMYKELENDGEDKIYDNMLGEMSSNNDESIESTQPKKGSNKPRYATLEEAIEAEESVFDDADGIGESYFSKQDDEEDNDDDVIDNSTPLELSENTDEFMRKALEEALDEAKKRAPKDPASDPNSILNDEEMMREINAVFDRANEQLLASIAEIREEQEALAKASAASRSEAMQEESDRLAEAEGSVTRLVEKVKRETEAVASAMADLEEAKKQLQADPLSQASDLKKAGIIKQGALVGALLFTLRSVGDLSMMTGPDGSSHGVAAAVQGVIALACALYFFFL